MVYFWSNVIKSRFITTKKVIVSIVVCFLAFMVINKGGYYYYKTTCKYKIVRKILKNNERCTNSRVSSYFPKGSVVVKPMGGLGNQLFQYAAAYNLAKQTNSKLYVIVKNGKTEKDIKDNISVYDRNFSLHKFNIPLEQIVFESSLTKDQTKLKVYGVNDKNFFSFKNKKNEGVLYLESYFESEIYFEEVRDEIRNLYTLRDNNFSHLSDKLNKISMPDAFCVHVRKGDMLKKSDAHYLSTEYQQQAMSLIKHINNNPKFFVFSDSLDIAKRDLQADQIEFFNNKPMEDFWLMMHCGNNVVANSTFSWWASYLNENKSKIVVAPLHKYTSSGYHALWKDRETRYDSHRLYSNSAYPKDWILLDYEKHDLVHLVKKVVPQSQQDDVLQHYKEKLFDIYSGDGLELSLCKDTTDSEYHVCKVNHDTSFPTVVTAYYEVKNKHSNKDFDKWMKNFLRIPFNLVVFTDKKHAKQIRDMRGSLPIKIIEKDLEDFYHYKYYAQYKKMSELDKDKRHSPELYMIWAEKVEFVMEAIELDPYKSNFFLWTDIGMMREERYISDKYPSNLHMISNKMSFFAIEDFSTDDFVSKTPPYNKVRMAGSPQVGDKFAWKLYNYLWDSKIISHLSKQIMITNDQAVIGSIILNYPEIARIIYPDIRFNGNRWWYSLIYLSNSENFGKQS